jgi:acyl-[acyl-carrier-protein]-phospholipid O-acyltransferase/long-chain-fatty-acid--[acyl-carrier-protein] ligase
MLEVMLSLIGLLVVFAATTWLFPSLLRPFFRLLLHTCYRTSFHHRDRVPAAGGGIIVCNHASYIDWLVLGLACRRRVTFVLWSSYYRNPLLRFFLSWARHDTIRIDDRTQRPHSILDSLKRVAAAVDAGRLVAIFPEGALTRSGNMLPFRSGIEKVLKLVAADVPVIPTGIQGLWGGFFSHGGGPALRKLPRAFRPRVAVWFGAPLRSRNLPAAGNLRLAVQEVLADLAIAESDRTPLVHSVFARNGARLRYFFQPCIIDNSAGPARTLSWGKTLIAALCATRYLRSRLGDQSNVGVWLPTSLGGFLANIGIAFLGRTSVNLNYTAGTSPVRSAIRQAGVKVIITARRFLSRMPLDLPEGVEAIYLEDVLESVTRWQKIRALLVVLFLPGWVIDRFLLGLHRHRLDTPLTIVFSSGSTGEPKGIVLTHRNIATNVISAIRTIGIAPSDRLFGTLPLFHSFGYTVCMWAPLVARCTVILFTDPRQAKEVGELCRMHRASLLVSTATFLRFYIRRCGVDDFRSLRMLICGAEKLPVKLQDEFREKFGVLPLEGYGCTELSPVVSTNLPDIIVDGFVQQRNHRGTVGQPIMGVCVRAFAIDERGGRAPLPVGIEGVLCARGPNVMSGYLHQPEKTADAIRDGWYNTGDRGLIESDGFIRITGRVSRFAKIAGEMVPLERLDDELHDVLGSGERMLAITSIPDEKRGERLIVLHLPDVEARLLELFDALGKRGIPNLWVPDRRDCHVVEVMPLLGSGKLDLKKLSDLAMELACRM